MNYPVNVRHNSNVTGYFLLPYRISPLDYHFIAIISKNKRNILNIITPLDNMRHVEDVSSY